MAQTAEQRRSANRERMRRKRASSPEYVEAERLRQAKYDQENREAVVARLRVENMSPERREAKARQNAAYREAHAEEIAAYYAAWWQEHKEEQREAKVRRKHGSANAPYVAILKADPCSYCDQPMDHVDHIDPIFFGGENSQENLTASCSTCNIKKGTKTLLIFLLTRQAS